jgi:hypothetical protein
MGKLTRNTSPPDPAADQWRFPKGEEQIRRVSGKLVRFTAVERLASTGASPDDLEVYRTAKGALLLASGDVEAFASLEDLVKHIEANLEHLVYRELYEQLGGAHKKVIPEI